MYINTVVDLDQVINNGPYAWPGGYPLYFVTANGGILSFDATQENMNQIQSAIIEHDDTQWQIIGYEINWEDSNLFCDHTGKQIESAYGEES